MEAPQEPPQAAHAAEPARPRRAGSLAIRIIVALVVVGGVAYVVRMRVNTRHDAAGAPGQGSGSDRVVPVQVASAEKKDLPIWLEGLGTVAAFQQVTVHAQVDGRLDKVLFTEGQPVKKGDVLAQIDPRPFLVQLHTGAGRARARPGAARRRQGATTSATRTCTTQNLVAQASRSTTTPAQVGQFEGAVKIDQAQIESAQLQLDYARGQVAARRHHRRAPGRRRQHRPRDRSRTASS